jgi:deazaflavin-dependent oxidoreductase (nitroreductase family)
VDHGGDRPQSAYHAPSWLEKKVSSVLAWGNIAERLTVTGRVSGKARNVAVTTVDVDGVKYLVSARGESQWVKNIRANPDVSLTVKGHEMAYTATEVPADQREPMLAAKFGRRGVGRFATKLPDATDHPTFKLSLRTAKR